MRIVGVSGGPTIPSRTKALVEFGRKQAVTPIPHTRDFIDVAESAPELAFTLARNNAAAEFVAVLEKIESAEILVVGTPISKGSYRGLLKHLFDLSTVSKDEVAIIAATNRGDSQFPGPETLVETAVEPSRLSHGANRGIRAVP